MPSAIQAIFIAQHKIDTLYPSKTTVVDTKPSELVTGHEAFHLSSYHFSFSIVQMQASVISYACLSQDPANGILLSRTECKIAQHLA